MIQLRRITKDNFDSIKNLKVADYQNHFVSSAVDSLAQAWLYAVNYLHNNFDCEEIYTGVYIGNNIAKHLYISFGFEETGKIEANMEELKYTFA